MAMDLRCNILLGLISGILLIAQAQDPSLSNRNVMRVEPNQASPSGLEQERKKLMYPFEPYDYLPNIGVLISTHEVSLPYRLPFFGFRYMNMFIHKDGYITFNKGLVSYNFPIQFPIHDIHDPAREEDPSLIAPWFSSQQLPRGVPDAGVYFSSIDVKKSDEILRERIIRDFREGMIGANEFTAKYAMIVTWKNVTFANPRPDRPLKTNTYQVVIATDEKNTYAMFNYEWLSWTSHMDNYEGMKGPQAFVGFNAGNMTRAFEFQPYSQSPYISTLPERGFANGIKGRYIFQINEEVYPGTCTPTDMGLNRKDRAPLTFFPRSGNMLGGTLVNITGPCFPKNKKTIEVTFQNTKVQCAVQDENHATCISPTVLYHGYIDIFAHLDDQQVSHIGKFYIQPPTTEDLKVSGVSDREVEPEMFELHWGPSSLSWNGTKQVKFHLWGYRETSGYPNLTYITELNSGVHLGATRYKLELEKFRSRDDSGKTDLTFGFISMNMSDSSVQESPIIWSRAMPLAWFFKPQWDKEYGSTNLWRDRQCLNWHQRELHRDRFTHTLPRCPCTKQQAEMDRGRFQPDAACNEIKRECRTFHENAFACFNAAITKSQTCCYDDSGELLLTADTMHGGRPSRASTNGKRPYTQSMLVPTLSHWVQDVLPYFVCCKWNPEEDNSDTCEKFKSQRPSQDCSSYSPPGVGSVFGDPHFLTFDSVNYTFNGKGEFVLTRVEEKYHTMDIQARFEQVPNRYLRDTGTPINGTVLTAVVAQDNQSSVVEFRLRPPSARWRYHLYVIVDKEYIYFPDGSFQSLTFPGVTVYQAQGTANMSHLVATFESGAGVEVHSGNGYMSANVFLPTSFKRKTRGLLGNWSEAEKDDFAIPNGQVLITSNATTGQIHKDFGNYWRLSEENKENVGQSLFYHDGVPFAHYDDPSFEPEFGNPPNSTANFNHFPSAVNQVCGSSMACRFDFIVTGDVVMAQMTKMQERNADFLARSTRQTVIRCPALQRPLNGRKSASRNYVGAEVHFTCDEGYELVGAQSRKCLPNGQWTWGLDSECIVDDRRR